MDENVWAGAATLALIVVVLATMYGCAQNCHTRCESQGMIAHPIVTKYGVQCICTTPPPVTP